MLPATAAPATTGARAAVATAAAVGAATAPRSLCPCINHQLSCMGGLAGDAIAFELQLGVGSVEM